MSIEDMVAAHVFAADRMKGHLDMVLGEELVRARIQEIEEAQARQRLGRLLTRRRRWARLAEFANRQARKADEQL